MSFVPHGNDTLSLPVSRIFRRLSSEAYKYRVKSLSVLIALLFFELGKDGFETGGGDGELFREFGLAGGWGER